LSEASTRVLFVRHARNDYLVSRRLPGRTPGIHLNERGLAEAEAVAERLASTPLAAVCSSPLDRTLETAGRIAERHEVRVQAMDGLMETDCGAWTGESIDDLSQTDLWRRIQAAPSSVRFPDGESMAEVQARMVGALAELLALYPGQRIVVVSHSDPIKLLLAFHIGLHMDMFQRLVVDPASISELEFESGRARLVRCNDCAHLALLGSGTA
jgi:probable phosphomutase (TIGR03848 family)